MKVLIVDDSRAMRLIVQRTLRQAGYDDLDIVEAASAIEGLEKVHEENPDLILSDWNMPEMSGIEMLEQLQNEGNPVKVGMVTSRGSDEMRERAADAGALFLLTKPFTADTFKEVLDSVLA